jgi:hypothetical protein
MINIARIELTLEVAGHRKAIWIPRGPTSSQGHYTKGFRTKLHNPTGAVEIRHIETMGMSLDDQARAAASLDAYRETLEAAGWLVRRDRGDADIVLQVIGGPTGPAVLS